MNDLKKNKKEKSQNGYGSFIKSSATLKKETHAMNDGVSSNEDNEKPQLNPFAPTSINTSFSTVTSDEALFAACGGRTAHK